MSVMVVKDLLAAVVVAVHESHASEGADVEGGGGDEDANKPLFVRRAVVFGRRVLVGFFDPRKVPLVAKVDQQEDLKE